MYIWSHFSFQANEDQFQSVAQKVQAYEAKILGLNYWPNQEALRISLRAAGRGPVQITTL